MLLTGTLELSFNHVLEEGGMVSQLREEGWVSFQEPFPQGWALRCVLRWKSPAGGGGSSIHWWWELTADTEVGMDLSGR